MEFIMPDLSNPGVWVSLLTLCFLEIVLGIDNIIFISIIAGKLPAEKQRRAWTIGLLLAMGFRVLLLLSISWIVGLKEPAITLPAIRGLAETGLALSYKDLILIAGGLFLIIKSTIEVHHKLSKPVVKDAKDSVSSTRNFGGVLLQILLIDAVFSFDSILTAVGLVDNLLIMITAVVVSIGVMMLFAGPVTRFINKQPTLQMLALTFLVVIGVVLIANGFHQEVSKGIIYSCLAFSLTVEVLNIKLRKRGENVQLNDQDVIDRGSN